MNELSEIKKTIRYGRDGLLDRLSKDKKENKRETVKNTVSTVGKQMGKKLTNQI